MSGGLTYSRFCRLEPRACSVIMSRDECYLATVDLFRCAVILLDEDNHSWGTALYRTAAAWRRALLQQARSGTGQFTVHVTEQHAEIVEGLSGDRRFPFLHGCTEFLLRNAYITLHYTRR